MRAAPKLPIDLLLDPGSPARPMDDAGQEIGRSREGREIRGYRIGNGALHISLIGGCHADEPVGPAMLDRLTAWLSTQPADSPWQTQFQWFLVPHTNPDGEARNEPWTGRALGRDAIESEIDLGLYLTRTVRETPGDDVEFGFPQHRADHGSRPENRAVANFLRPGAPFALHASFHGMAFAAGPWFLLERAWIDRTADLRNSLRQRVGELGYLLHDIDRGGEKGFDRIDEGFTTRPDSRAMAAHFLAADDPATAALFRPSSMEFVRSLGGDPLTLVSEMPLFLVPAEHYVSGDVVRPAVIREIASQRDPGQIRRAAAQHNIRPMPIRDQMRLQLEYLQAGLDAVGASLAEG